MKIAIVSFYFTESTVALAKHLAMGDDKVDYYVVADRSSRDLPGISFEGVPTGLGLFALDATNSPSLHAYTAGSVNAHLIRLAGFGRSSTIPNKFILWNACRKLKREGYDVVNIVGHHPLLVDCHRILSRTPRIHTLHEVAAHYPGQRILAGLLEHLIADRIPMIVHSTAAKEALESHAGDEPLAIHRIPFGTFESFGSFVEPSAPKPDGKKTILFYGIIKEYKGLDVLVEAIRRIAPSLPDVEFVIAGKGTVPALEDARSIPQVKIINRHLSNAEIASLNQQAYAVVCPYRSASQSGIVATTFFFGKPLLASDVGAFSEFVQDGVNGLLFPPDDPEILARSIVRVVQDEPLHARLSKGALEYGRSGDFAWPDIASKTREAYVSCMRSRTGARETVKKPIGNS